MELVTQASTLQRLDLTEVVRAQGSLGVLRYP